jgi:hypothetical protein
MLDKAQKIEILEFYDGTLGSCRELARRFNTPISTILYITNHSGRRDKLKKYRKKYKNLQKLMKNQKEFFIVSQVCREDIKGRGYNVSKLDDSDMQRFAEKMGDAICEGDYWPVLDGVAEYVFNLKKNGKTR